MAVDRYENDLMLIDRGWRYDVDGGIWVFPRNRRTFTRKKVSSTDTPLLTKLAVLVERGFVFNGRKWIRSGAVIDSEDLELPVKEFVSRVRLKQRESGGNEWVSRLPPG